MDKTKTTDQGKLKMALLSIALSAAALVIDYIRRKPIVDTISAGFAIAFVAFLLSLSAVRDHRSNLPAQIAFWFGFLAMWGTLALCLL